MLTSFISATCWISSGGGAEIRAFWDWFWAFLPFRAWVRAIRGVQMGVVWKEAKDRRGFIGRTEVPSGWRGGNPIVSQGRRTCPKAGVRAGGKVGAAFEAFSGGPVL